MGNRVADAEQLNALGDQGSDSGTRKRDWPIVVRPARAEDRAAVLKFATNTWDGWDYIPHAWPVWLAAEDGVMLVATRPADDTPIALTRVAMVSPTEAWWEGIRVDPELRGMDVAADLQVAELHWSAAQGANIIRYATSAQNEGSHRLGARHGLKLLESYRNYWWSPEPGDPHGQSGFDPAVRAEATLLRREVRGRLGQEGGVLEPGQDAEMRWRTTFTNRRALYEPRPWAMGELTGDRFMRHVEREEVIGFDEDAVAILLREQLAGEDSSLRLAYLDGPPDAVVALLDRIVAASGGNTLRFRLQEGSDPADESHQALMARGYQVGEWPLHILGRRIDDQDPLPWVDPNAVVLADEPRPVITPLTF